ERIVSHQRCADLALAVVLPGRHRCGGDVLHLSPRAHSGLLGWDDHDPEQDEHDGAARPESRASPQVRGPAFTWRRGASIAIAAAAAAVTSPLIGSARPAGAAGSATTAGLAGLAFPAGVRGPIRPARPIRPTRPGPTRLTRPARLVGPTRPPSTVAAPCGDVELLQVVGAHRPIMRTPPCRLPISRSESPSRRRPRCTRRR